MAPSFDRALWHRFHERRLSVYTVSAVYLGTALALALPCFIVIEKRTRSSWQRVPAKSGVAGDGPYRQGVIAALLDRAPARVRPESDSPFLFTSSVACLLGMFDDIEVMAYGIHERATGK